MSTLWISSVVLVVAAVAGWQWRRRRSFRHRLRRVLRDNGDALLRDLVIPDGLDGQIHLSHVLRTTAGFVVIDVLPMSGAVFGAPNTDEWTVFARGRAHKFRNPAAMNRARVLAVRGLVPGVPVHGVVVLLGNVLFPKGVPQGTVTLETLPAALAALPAAPAGTGWDDAWVGLAACAASAG